MILFDGLRDLLVCCSFPDLFQNLVLFLIWDAPKRVRHLEKSLFGMKRDPGVLQCAAYLPSFSQLESGESERKAKGTTATMDLFPRKRRHCIRDLSSFLYEGLNTKKVICTKLGPGISFFCRN